MAFSIKIVFIMFQNKYIKYIQVISGTAIVSVIVVIIMFYTAEDATFFEKEVKMVTKDSIGLTLSEGDIENVEIKQIPVSNTIEQKLIYPELDRALVFTESFPDDARAVIQNNVKTLASQLEIDHTSFQNWLDLAMQYKIAGDYEGARDILEFLSIVSPQNSVSFRNLGDLYGYYLTDKQKAEENLLKAIEISPSEIEYYIKTMEFYRDVMKDNEKARQIIERGVNSNPASEELKSFLKNPNLQ